MKRLNFHCVKFMLSLDEKVKVPGEMGLPHLPEIIFYRVHIVAHWDGLLFHVQAETIFYRVHIGADCSRVVASGYTNPNHLTEVLNGQVMDNNMMNDEF